MSPDQQRLVRVFCADDQPIFRRALRELIAATPGLIHIGDAACGEEAIAAVAALRPDLVLMDVHMPGVDGFEAARILVERHRDLVVVVMSADRIDWPLGFSPRDQQVVSVAKQDLSRRALLDVWNGRRTR